MIENPEEQNKDFTLPALNPLMKIFKASNDRDGRPRWSLYHPASNKYFYLSWVEFECLGRFHKYKTASELIESVNAQTTLSIDLDDVKALVMFLQTQALVSSEHQAAPQLAKEKPLWERIVHGYLYFTLPLFKPETFLKNTLHYVTPLLTKKFMMIMVAIMTLGVFLTLQRLDEFTHTFLEMFTLRGAILTAIVFMGIKIIHEFAHAYVATKHGVRVPHMGVAFIVMYPVLYTETTASWQIESKEKRIEIGLAGVMAELSLAAIALMLWHILPPGMGQSIAFSVVAISLIGSLFINLNPLMRFDGYFVLSDALNIENLHARAIDLARWRLRKALFNLKDPPPDHFDSALQTAMLVFGFAIIIYRFFLFAGIALLVYHVFFKPLGFIMMLLELIWFMGMPLWSELKVWWQRRADIWAQKRARGVFAVVGTLVLITLLPIQTQISAPAVMHAAQIRTVYSPSAAYIAALKVKDTQQVQEGEVLAVLESTELEKELRLAGLELKSLQDQIRRQKTDPALYRESAGRLEGDLEKADKALETLKNKKDRLVVKAPFDGVIRDLSPDIHVGRFVSSAEALFTILKPQEIEVTAYVGEESLSRLKNNNKAAFYPDFAFARSIPLVLQQIDPVNINVFTKPELASVFGGDIPSAMQEGHAVPLAPTYAANLKTLKNIEKTQFSQKGQVHIHATRQSAILSGVKRIIALFVRESGLN